MMRIQQRLLCLSFIDHSLDACQFAGLMVNEIIGVARQSNDKLSSGTFDGCNMNTAAVNLIKAVFPYLLHFICLSHSANIPVSKLDKTCLTAKKFMLTYSNALTWSCQLRRYENMYVYIYIQIYIYTQNVIKYM
jgi:hypothetical protein